MSFVKEEYEEDLLYWISLNWIGGPKRMNDIVWLAGYSYSETFFLDQVVEVSHLYLFLWL